MIKKILLNLFFFTVLLLGSSGHAGHFGFNAGTGLPYVGQFGLNYVSSSNTFSVDVSYNHLSLSIDTASVEMTKPEINFKWHPFHGSFFMGVGIGQSSMTAEATDQATSQTASAEVTSLTVTPNIGWMWGATNGGFFIGLDIGLQNPIDAETTITSSLPANNEAYQDVEEAGDQYGVTSFPIATFLRLGYLF